MTVTLTRVLLRRSALLRNQRIASRHTRIVEYISLTPDTSLYLSFCGSTQRRFPQNSAHWAWAIAALGNIPAGRKAKDLLHTVLLISWLSLINAAYSRQGKFGGKIIRKFSHDMRDHYEK